MSWSITFLQSILGTLLKYHSSLRVSISSIYLAYLEIIQLSHLFLIILKIRNHLLFVINIINLLEEQYSVTINWLLILILILRLQIHEILKIQNSVMNHQAILLQEIRKSFQIQESVLLFQKVQNIDALLRLISINVEKK